MHVELLYHTPDPERAIATAARLCYAPVGAAELMETMPDKRVRSVLSTIMRSGHFSTLEHASYTFAVDGVSRALTHQLVRHRIASFNQQSQRYVKFTEGLATIKPESVLACNEANAAFDEAIAASALLRVALLQPRTVGDSRNGARDAGACPSHGALRVRGRRRALRAWFMSRGKNDVREPVSARDEGLTW